MELFLDCLYDDELKVLIISGEADEAELRAAWNKVYLEYCSLMQENSYNEVFDLTVQINWYNARIDLVDRIVVHLKMAFDQVLIDILNGEDMRLQCNVKEEDRDGALIAKLNRVVSKAKKWLVELEIAEARLEELQSETAEATTREDFEDSVLVIGKYNGYHIKKMEITVSEYCRMLKKLDKEYQRQLGLKK